MSRRDPGEIARSFERIEATNDRAEKTRRMRDLLAQGGHELMSDSCWRDVSTGECRFLVISFPFNSSQKPDSKWRSGNLLLEYLKGIQERYELENHDLSTWRSVTDFEAAHHFLSFSILESQSSPMSKWRAQVPPLPKWTLEDSDGNRVELVSDAHPGNDAQFGDHQNLIAKLCVETLGRLQEKARQYVENYVGTKEERLRATLRHVEELISQADDERRREALLKEKAVLLIRANELVERRDKEAARQRAEAEFKLESGLIQNAAIDLENELNGTIHSKTVKLSDDALENIRRVVADPNDDFGNLCPEDGCKAITAIRALRDDSRRAPLPILFAEFRTKLENARPWFVVEWVTNDFQLFCYAKKEMMKVRDYLRLHPGVAFVLHSRARALIKQCIQTPSTPDDVRAYLDTIHTSAMPTSLDQLELAVAMLDKVAMFVTTRASRISPFALCLADRSERVDQPHREEPEVNLATSLERQPETVPGLRWSEDPETGDLSYGDDEMGIVGTAKCGNVDWAVLVTLKFSASSELSYEELARGVDLTRSKVFEEREKFNSGIPQPANKRNKYTGSRARVGKLYYGRPAPKLRSALQASLRRMGGEKAKRWRSRWLHWNASGVSLGYGPRLGNSRTKEKSQDIY